MPDINTNHLKRFAQEARRKLLEQVGSKMEYVLTSDSAELREKASQVKKLQEEINAIGKEQVIDKVAYTWFNRFMALRFMDANDYQPIGIRVVTPKDGYTLPELLDEAKQGHIPEELHVKHQHIYDILDGRVPSSNPQNEAYKELLIGACNHLHTVFPFLFERINDYTELLLPDDLISEFSIVQDIRDGMTQEDCQEVEIIGWLYQFYISEKKDELINAKKRYKADEIAPVTQLFTPKWIVQYMVDNTLGQLWKEARPNTKITDNLEFYIKPNNPELIPSRDVKSVEEITFFDPCVGSAHVLCYAFDIFYKIYEEEGYNPTDIPELIITKNLYGIDIDDRAAQLASFALMMKGRKHHKRFFRKQVVPNITAFQNIETHAKFENAKVLGSLIKITKEEADDIQVDETSLFVERDLQLKKQACLLAEKYDVVVTNPPYLNSSYMEGTLKQFVEKEYKMAKSDLFACFFVQATHLTKKDGLIGLISPFVWMFIKSYEWLRNYIIEDTTIASLVQLEYNAFGPAMVPVETHVLRNNFIEGYKGSYIKLSDFKGVENQKSKTLEAIINPNCDWFYLFNQKDFKKIPGFPIGYWLSEQFIEMVSSELKIGDKCYCSEGIKTSDNSRYLRLIHEVKKDSIQNIWSLHYKGGAFRKWSGNLEHCVYWKDNGYALRRLKSSGIQGEKTFSKLGISWSDITSGGISFRIKNSGCKFDSAAPSGYFMEGNLLTNIGFLNSKIVNLLAKIYNPTLHFKVGNFRNLPLPTPNDFIESIVEECINISTLEWSSRETAWEFKANNIIRIKGKDLEESYDLYQQYWKNKFIQLHRNEEENNQIFIKIYGLQEELSPEVPLEDITILKEEIDIVNNQLVFDSKEVFAQFVSYAVGCMFGRYSLDKEGLILANQSETLEDYLSKVGKSEDEVSFLPDDDNIIPVLDDEWFEDDIVGRFYEFLKASFGKANFDKNLAFVEECLGKDIRKYFVKDFYKDHVRRYKTRPIYWMFSSPKGAFNVLMYMHRYTPDTLNQILNDYLIEYREKLNTKMEHLNHLIETGSSSVQTKAAKEKDKLKLVLLELQEYEREVLYPLAAERIVIDLDDGVLVNYNKFGEAIKKVNGLNDKKAKDKVKKFDWIDTATII